MNKKLLRYMSALAVILVCISSVALAAPGISGDYTQGSGTFSTTVNIKDVGISDKVTLIVVKQGTDLTNFESDDILYIAQKKPVSGNASFQFVTTTEKFDVYSGYSIKPRTDAPLDLKYLSDPELNNSESELSANTAPFGIEGCKRIFIKLTNNNGEWIPEHSGEGSEIYYSTELNGYDGIVKTNATDIGAIFSEITWTRGKPGLDATISQYGDISGDGNISAEDYVSIRKYMLGTVKYSIKQNLSADVSGDSTIKAIDYISIRKKLLQSIAEFAMVINKK